MGFIEEIKSITNVIQQAGNIELYQKISDLQSEALVIIEENQDLKKENFSLKQKLHEHSDVKFEQDAYWLSEDGPYCTRCYDKDACLLRMHPLPNRAFYKCPECKTIVRIFPKLDRGATQLKSTYNNLHAAI